MSHRK